MDKALINYYRIEKAVGYLTENFKEQPDLAMIARKVHMSTFHFQRIFTDWIGISPKKFVQYLTLDYLREKIHETENMIEAAVVSGLSSQSRVHDLFVHIDGVSPLQYKSAGEGLIIYYGYHGTPFGLCFIAASEKGICCLKFIDEEKSRNEFEIFQAKWPFATIIHKPGFTQKYIRNIFKPSATNPEKLNLLVQGTEFQIKVWEALTKIPFGAVSSFQNIANMIGKPDAAKAVGGAVASNTILYLIPCHRIILKNGSAGEYSYGKARKQSMIGWEMANKDIHKTQFS